MPEPAPVEQANGHRALYRRWRAQRFGELIGQDPIVTTLRRAVAGDRIAHAYLFVGPRGTGKTSTARILAKAINCTNLGPEGEPCDTCPACVSIREGRAMDVIEIDAASHGLVEDARDLVMRALTAPAELRKRVYVIDEVHMLSTHAFNALLKLIEEPPDHVVFVLATTDTHKIPATIISRTQRFDFRRIGTDAIVGKLTRIAEAEGADVEPEALTLIARLANGGMRDAESLFDQVLSYADARITAATVRDAVGLADEAEIAALVDAYQQGDPHGALEAIERLADVGRDMGQVATQAEENARDRLLASTEDPATARRLATILRTLAEAASTGAREGRARLALELLAVEPLTVIGAPAAAPRPERRPAAVVTQAAGPGTTAVATPAAEPAVRKPTIESPRAAPEAPRQVARTPASDPPAQAAPVPEVPAEVGALRSRWAEVIDGAPPALKPLLRECRPVAVNGVRLTLAFPEERGFMREKATTRSSAIEHLLGATLGGTWVIECISSNVELEPLTVAQAVAGDPQDADGAALLEGVLRITGGELVDAPEVR